MVNLYLGLSHLRLLRALISTNYRTRWTSAVNSVFRHVVHKPKNGKEMFKSVKMYVCLFIRKPYYLLFSVCPFQMTSSSRSLARPRRSALAPLPLSTGSAWASTQRRSPWRCPSSAAPCRVRWRAARRCWCHARAATPWTSLRCVPASSPHWHAERPDASRPVPRKLVCPEGKGHCRGCQQPLNHLGHRLPVSLRKHNHPPPPSPSCYAAEHAITIAIFRSEHEGGRQESTTFFFVLWFLYAFVFCKRFQFCTTWCMIHYISIKIKISFLRDTEVDLNHIAENIYISFTCEWGRDHSFLLDCRFIFIFFKECFIEYSYLI